MDGLPRYPKMKRFFLLAVVQLSAASLLAGQSAPVELLAVQTGILPRSAHGVGKGDFPHHIHANPFEFGEWATGTNVLLRTKLPTGAVYSKEPGKLISFTDDTGKNLARAAEGASLPREFEPVVTLFDEKNGDLYVAVRGLRAPSKKSTSVSGELEIVTGTGQAQKVESLAFLPSQARVVKAGSITLNVVKFGRMDPNSFGFGGHHQPGTSRPSVPVNANQLVYSIAESPDDVPHKITCIEVLDSSGRVVNKNDRGDFTPGGGTNFGVQVEGNGPFKIRLTLVDPSQMQPLKLSFTTGLGVSEE